MDRPSDVAAASDAGSALPAAHGKVVVVMPAYNAARTLERTYADIPHDIVDGIILVDDVSKDETVDIARQLGLDVII
ncbi:MAG TPA: glycosyltransferase, partial [Candidatus Limnocylindrales bacterium]